MAIYPIPDHNFQFDEENFLDILKKSVSLSVEKKIEIIEKIPILWEKRIQKLVEVFEKEQKDLDDMEEKHGKEKTDEKRKKTEKDWKRVLLHFDKKAYDKERKQTLDDIRDRLSQVE